MEQSKKFFTVKKSKISQKPQVKNSTSLPLPDIIVKPWQMMVNTFPYHAPRNKNFSMHTPWVKNFLLSQNTNFTSKKFLPPFHSKIKFFCLLHMIAQWVAYHLPRNKNFILHTPWDKNFLLPQNPKFSKNHK